MTYPQSDPDLSLYAGRLGARIRRAREKAGISAEECAERIGITVAGWYHLERGRRRLYADQAVAIAVVLGVPVESLLRDSRQK